MNCFKQILFFSPGPVTTAWRLVYGLVQTVGSVFYCSASSTSNEQSLPEKERTLLSKTNQNPLPTITLCDNEVTFWKGS